MSIKQSLLALLGQGPSYGYQLKAEFEERTGGTWPLNIGQVYTTLDRLERDGLVARAGEDAEGRVIYTLTALGQAEADAWLQRPVVGAQQRNELTIKIALAVTLPGVDVTAIVQAQRTASLVNLQNLVKARRTSDDLAWQLVVENLIFAAEAEVRWLDHCEAAVLKGARSRPIASVARAEDTARVGR